MEFDNANEQTSKTIEGLKIGAYRVTGAIENGKIAGSEIDSILGEDGNNVELIITNVHGLKTRPNDTKVRAICSVQVGEKSAKVELHPNIAAAAFKNGGKIRVTVKRGDTVREYGVEKQVPKYVYFATPDVSKEDLSTFINQFDKKFQPANLAG